MTTMARALSLALLVLAGCATSLPEPASDDRHKSRGHWFFGVGCDTRLYGVLNRRVYELHDRGVAGYGQPTANLFARSQKGDTLVILQALDTAPSYRLPAEYHDFLPKPWAEVEVALKAGEAVGLKGEARGFKTILLAAPTTQELERLVRITEMLK